MNLKICEFKKKTFFEIVKIVEICLFLNFKIKKFEKL